jgi:hypothetical protein
MPCMYNGQPVKGNKGSCPMNSTWVEPEAPAPVDDRNILQKGLGWVAENPLEAASYAAMAIPGLGWAGGGALAGTRALLSGGKMASRTGKLMDKLFRKSGGTVYKPPVAGGGVLQGGQKFTPKMFNQTTKGGLPVQPKFNAYNAPYNKTAGRVMRKPSLMGAGMTGLAGAGAGGLYASGADDRLAAQQALQTQQQQQASTAMDANTKALMDANATKAEADRVANLNPMERIMENLNKPGFLTDPLIEGGPPGYNRLSKLGVLMDYYGSTPKQRATKTSPNEQFASIEKDVLANQTALAKAQATLTSPFGKPTVNTLADSLMNKVKTEFGDTWLTFGAKDDQLEPIAKAIAVRITQLTAKYPQADPKAIEEEAFKQIEEEGWKSVA